MKNRVHLICNAHLDPVWQWRWTEGCSEALATFRNAIDILDEFPELVFNHNEAVLYRWVRQYDPPLFSAIRDRVEKGRWFIAGGWYLQPDVNLPPLENLIRNIRMGRDFFRSEFGAEPKVAYNFDSFGHPAGLPQVLREFGYKMYVHQRPEAGRLDLPANLYNWKGLGGHTIPAYRIEIGLYHTERNNIAQRMEAAAALALDLGRDVALFWGLGDHGGGATRTDLRRIREVAASDERVEFIHSTTDRFLDSVAHLLPTLPVFEGSLQRVFAGCYTSAARIKRKAVEASAAVRQAEELLLAGQAVSTDNPEIKEVTDDIWRDILFNDFHDILPGSCTETAETDALELYGRALENIRRLNLSSITRLNRMVMPLEAHIPVTLFHSFQELAGFPVEFECMSDYRPFWEGERILRLFNRSGKEIPCQEEESEARLPFHRWRRKVVFLAEGLPAGVHHFRLEAFPVGQPHPAISDPAAPATLPPVFKVMEDLADSWGTDTCQWRSETGNFTVIRPSSIIEKGPVRTIRETLLTFNLSAVSMQELSYGQWPVTEYRIRIRWNEERKRLKLSIPVPEGLTVLSGEIPGGAERIPDDGTEYVHGTWLECLGEGEPLRIVHNGLHGVDFDGHEIRLSILRSAAYCHEQGYDLDNGRTHRFMDQGIHEVRLAVWRGHPNPAAVSAWLNAPPLVWPHLPVGPMRLDAKVDPQQS